jgi:glycosyltransferase involved in cell wall biosynthesis
VRVCYALLYRDTADPEVAPERLLERRLMLRHLPREMAARGHETMVVQHFPTRVTLDDEGVRHELVPPSRWARAAAGVGGRLLSREPGYLEVATSAARTIRRFKPDVVHYFGLTLTLNLALVELALGRRGPPIVVSYHGGWPPANPLLRRIQGVTLDRASRLLFTARELARPFVEAGFLSAGDSRIAEVMEVSTPFRMQDRAAARAVTGMTGDPVVVWAGRLDPVKDPLTALRGFDRIRAEWAGARLYLYYLTDTLLPELRAFVASRPGLADHVHFRGRVAHDQMEAIFNSSDLLLQASRSVIPGRMVEYSGFVPLEAMACGVVPALTDLPSFRAMTDGGRHGLLFPVGDDAGLARKVLGLERGSIPAIGAAVHGHFEHSLSFRALAARLEQVYQGAVAARAVSAAGARAGRGGPAR